MSDVIEKILPHTGYEISVWYYQRNSKQLPGLFVFQFFFFLDCLTCRSKIYLHWMCFEFELVQKNVELWTESLIGCVCLQKNRTVFLFVGVQCHTGGFSHLLWSMSLDYLGRLAAVCFLLLGWWLCQPEERGNSTLAYSTCHLWMHRQNSRTVKKQVFVVYIYLKLESSFERNLLCSLQTPTCCTLDREARLI